MVLIQLACYKAFEPASAHATHTADENEHGCKIRHRVKEGESEKESERGGERETKEIEFAVRPLLPNYTLFVRYQIHSI